MTSPIVLASNLPAYMNTTALTIQGDGATVNGSGLYTLIIDTSLASLTIDALTLIHSRGDAIGLRFGDADRLDDRQQQCFTVLRRRDIRFGLSVDNGFHNQQQHPHCSGDGGGAIVAPQSVMVNIDDRQQQRRGYGRRGGIALVWLVMVTNSTIANNNAIGRRRRDRRSIGDGDGLDDRQQHLAR